MIYFHEERETFYLENSRVTYAFRIRKGEVEHLWFGKKVGRDDLSYVHSTAGSGCDAALPERFSPHFFGQEAPTYGQGDFHEPMLTYRGENGDICAELRYTGHRILPSQKIDGMPSTFGGETLEVTLLDEIQGVEVTLCYTIFEDVDAITRSARIRKVGEGSIVLGRAYSFNFDLHRQDLDVISLHGAWATERSVERTPVHHGVWSIDSKRVSSSSQLNPFMAVVAKDTTERAGDAWGVTLVYSSSYRLFVEADSCGNTRLGGGVNDFAFSWKLEAGETFSTPEAILVYSDEGIGGMSRIFHDTLRGHLINPRYVNQVRPIVINNWEGTYFNFNTQKLFDMIDAAAGTGIDTFVLDDGWFGKRDDDHSGLGDWFINTQKLTGGLKPIIDRCHQRGLKFGLWFEPEMINPDSDLYRAHPDWAIHAPGHRLCEGRNQCVLDLTRADVRDYIVNVVNGILDTHEIDYVKWTTTAISPRYIPPLSLRTDKGSLPIGMPWGCMTSVTGLSLPIPIFSLRDAPAVVLALTAVSSTTSPRFGPQMIPMLGCGQESNMVPLCAIPCPLCPATYRYAPTTKQGAPSPTRPVPILPIWVPPAMSWM